MPSLHHAAYTRVASRLTPHTLRIPILRNRERRARPRRARRPMHAGAWRAPARPVRRGRGAALGRPARQCRGPRVRIARGRERIETLSARAARAALTLIDRRQARLERAGQLLAALSYHGVLARGFALVRAEDGRPLRAAAAVSPGTAARHRIRRRPCPGNVRRCCDRRRQTGGTTAGGATANGDAPAGRARWSGPDHRARPAGGVTAGRSAAGDCSAGRVRRTCRHPMSR